MEDFVGRKIPAALWKVFRVLARSAKNRVFGVLCFFFSFSKAREHLLVVDTRGDADQVREIKERCAFYVPQMAIEVVNTTESRLKLKDIYSSSPILLAGGKGGMPSWVTDHRKNLFDVDYVSNFNEGWEWHRLLDHLSQTKEDDLTAAKSAFVHRLNELECEQYNKCYIFGTGPSLEKAISHDWSDGYRIVCNTIVRDPELWHHINPHFIVAGDAIYHFGHTDFAKAFRRDLANRLAGSDTMFIYPALFHSFVVRHFSHLKSRLIPIVQKRQQKIQINLRDTFELPGLGNILALLLLPVACTCSKTVCMFGFDGRAPDDKLFWSNSGKHSYPELMEGLRRSHPGFFKHYIKNNDPQRYVKSFHGDILDEKMSEAEAEGWRFTMLHKSWTPTFQKRYVRQIQS